MQSHHIIRSLANKLACWLLRTAAAEWWPVLAIKAQHLMARDGAPNGQNVILALADGVHYRLMRQRRAGVTRPMRVPPRSARDRSCSFSSPTKMIRLFG
jgi:hypothetical protein